jgi:hypothetical protein
LSINYKEVYQVLILGTWLDLLYSWKTTHTVNDPAYLSRRQDGVYFPTIETFNKAYNIIQLSSLPSKTKETLFQIINRTIWTNNNAFKSGARENPDCEYCGQVETMEHLIHDCENYSTPLWVELGESLTQTLRATTGRDMAEIRFTPLEIIFNKIHPTIQVYIKEKSLQRILLHLLQEVKRDIIFRRMNPNVHLERVNQNRIRAHLLSTVSKITSLLQYQETGNHQDSINLLVHLQRTISD